VPLPPPFPLCSRSFSILDKYSFETITNKHKKWLETPGKNDQPRNDSAIRIFYDNENIFKEKWDLIENKLDNPKQFS